MILSYDQRIMTGQYPVADLMGYRHTKDGRLVIEPEEAKTVRFIFLAFIQGYNYDQIAAVLTQKKRSTLRGRQEWNGMMVANIMACIRLFEGIKYVLPILHPNKKRLALIMCPEEDSASVEWARQKGENWVNKDITSLEFVENIFRLMNWNRECRYKVLGRVANSDQGLCMLFDLEEAIMFTPKPQEYADPLTGEMKKKQMKFFPDTYRNRIGKSYNDYIADHQMNMFEDFIGYQGSAVLDEPVREEDSFSKESMSQESEISENILLPDLAKQSESIEQQSGEIAERGMPT